MWPLQAPRERRRDAQGEIILDDDELEAIYECLRLTPQQRLERGDARRRRVIAIQDHYRHVLCGDRGHVVAPIGRQECPT
jgi:hypothetical protein